MDNPIDGPGRYKTLDGRVIDIGWRIVSGTGLKYLMDLSVDNKVWYNPNTIEPSSGHRSIIGKEHTIIAKA